MKVSIVIPTLNEEGGIGPTLDAVDRAAFAAAGWELEMLIVDGNSKDRTRAIAESKGARVVVEPRRGYGRAYKEGFKAATGDVIVTGDADGTYPLERAHEVVKLLLDEGLDFVNCDRYGKLEAGAMSGKHLLGNWVLSTTTRLLFGIRLHDSQSGMWAIRRSALASLDVEAFSEGMAFSQEVKVEFWKGAGLKTKEIPASLRPRIGTPVLASWRDGIGNLKALFRLRAKRAWDPPAKQA